MPLLPTVATQLTTPETLTDSVYIGGERVGDIFKWDSLNVTDGGAGYVGTLDAHLEALLADVPSLTDQAQIRLVDHTADIREWTGYVTKRQPGSVPGYTGRVDITATDISGLLDDCFIAFEKRPEESIGARMGALLGKYAGSHLSHDLSFIEALGDDCSAQRFVSLTLRDAIEVSIAQASDTADYRVDMYGRIHIFETESNDAPFEINVDSQAGGEIDVESLSVQYDAEGYYNGVYVQGANAAGSGYFFNGAAVARAGGLTRVTRVEAPDADTPLKARRFARRFLNTVSNSVARGQFETLTEGWASGQNVTITSAELGLSAEVFTIARVTWRYIRPGTNRLRRYIVEFGDSQAMSTV